MISTISQLVACMCVCVVISKLMEQTIRCCRSSLATAARQSLRPASHSLVARGQRCEHTHVASTHLRMESENTKHCLHRQQQKKKVCDNQIYTQHGVCEQTEINNSSNIS
jgi:hypothetical protein